MGLWDDISENEIKSNVSTLSMGLINKVDMVCLSPVGYGV